MITGRSVHNQRIGRLWRDLFSGCVMSWRMRAFLILTVFALHYVYFPLLNYKLEQFRRTWSHHPLRTEHNKTPHQLVLSVAHQICLLSRECWSQ